MYVSTYIYTCNPYLMLQDNISLSYWDVKCLTTHNEKKLMKLIYPKKVKCWTLPQMKPHLTEKPPMVPTNRQIL